MLVASLTRGGRLGFLLCLVVFVHSASARPKIDVSPGTTTQFRIQRGLISSDLAETLFRDILEEAVPGPKDDFHESLLGIHGDGGASIAMDATMTPLEVLATRFQKLAAEESDEDNLESAILRVEHLKQEDQDRVDEIIDDVVENRVMADGGTIHLYLSGPNAAALDNHTDTTDIFVLHLHGAKTWLICPPKGHKSPSALVQEKLDKCSTYDSTEMNQLECESQTLYPGDALVLPRRIIHSARATPMGLSAHLTFGIANEAASADSGQCLTGESVLWNKERSLQGTCTQAQGGSNCDLLCNTGCDGSCNSDCNTNCNCLCDSSNGRSSCDGCCNGSCNSGCNLLCNSGCRSGCDICPSSSSTSTTVTPPPPPPTFPPPPPFTPPPRPPPPPPPCRNIQIQEACGELATNVVEGKFWLGRAPGFNCTNDNMVNDLIYTRIWRKDNGTSNGFLVLYFGESVPPIVDVPSRPRWMIADDEVFCSNSRGRMAFFEASRSSPHLVVEDAPKIFCSDRVVGPSTSGMQEWDLEIACLDPTPTPVPTSEAQELPPPSPTLLPPPPALPVPSSEVQEIPPPPPMLAEPAKASSAAVFVPFVAHGAILSALVSLLALTM